MSKVSHRSTNNLESETTREPEPRTQGTVHTVLKRAFIGYSRSETQAFLNDLETTRRRNSEVLTVYLNALRGRLQTVRQKVQELEHAVATESEEQRALLATLEVLADLGGGKVRSLKAQLTANEQEKLAQIARDEAMLGEQRALLRHMRERVLSLTAQVNEELHLPEAPSSRPIKERQSEMAITGQKPEKQQIG